MRIERFHHFNFQLLPGLLPILLLTLLLLSCNKKKENPGKIPSINFNGMSANTIVAGSNQIINVNFYFADGDGDLGNEPASGNFDIYTIDSRDTSKVNYFFPQGLADYIDPENGLSGNFDLGIEGAFLLLSPGHTDRDTVRYEIYIKDKAGNESNHFTTPDIYIVQ